MSQRKSILESDSDDNAGDDDAEYSNTPVSDREYDEESHQITERPIFIPSFPSFSTTKTAKRITGHIMLWSGVIGLILACVILKERTVMTVNVPSDGAAIGKITTPPVSQQLFFFSPLRVISLGSIIFGVLSIMWPCDETLYTSMPYGYMTAYKCRLFYYTTMMQTAIIMVTAYPLAGASEFHELLFIGTLACCEILFIAYSDMINAPITQNWELCDTFTDQNQNERPIETLHRIADCLRTQRVTDTSVFTFMYEPLVVASAIHVLLHVVLLVHMIKSLSNEDYKIIPAYVFLVFITVTFQTAMISAKFLHMLRFSCLRLFKSYRFVLLFVDIIECMNIFFYIITLVISNSIN